MFSAGLLRGNNAEERPEEGIAARIKLLESAPANYPAFYPDKAVT